MSPDGINGLFELAGSAFVWLNVRRVLVDRCIRGVSPWAVGFFMGWGLWNLYYYPHLGQWWSLAGGCSIALANVAWLAAILYYWRR